MSILPYQDILSLCNLEAADPVDRETCSGAIIPCLKKNIRSAGYDLRLGGEYYYAQTKKVGGKLQIQQLEPQRARTLIIPPNQVVIITTLEKLKLPANLVGHLTLKLDLLLRGLIMANQSQVDAGYEGSLFILLYNLSNENVPIQFGQSILRLELAELKTSTVTPYIGAYKKLKLSEAIKSPVESSLHKMRQDVDGFRKQLTITQWIGIVFLVATSILTYIGPLSTRMTKIEQQVADVEKVHALESSLHDKASQAELESLHQELENLKLRFDALSRSSGLPPPNVPPIKRD